jgi:hypothetical protein
MPADGKYEIEVRGWDNSTGGGYTLVLEANRSDISATKTRASVEQTGTALWGGLGEPETITLTPSPTPT